MFMTPHFVFVHLQKCAGTSVRAMLEALFPKGQEVGRRHGGVSEIPDKYADRPVLGSIRDPYAWYVSFYHWNMQKGSTSPFRELVRGASFKMVLHRIMHVARGRMHDVDFDRMRELGVGMLTHRYLNAYSADPSADAPLVTVPDVRFIRTEHVGPDFRTAMAAYGIPVDDVVRVAETAPLLNTTLHGGVAEHYDAESSAWVEEQDAAIFARHGYEIPTKQLTRDRARGSMR